MQLKKRFSESGDNYFHFKKLHLMEFSLLHRRKEIKIDDELFKEIIVKVFD